MNTQKAYEIIEQACSDYEDGQTGVSACVEMFVEENNLSHDVDEVLGLYFKNEARQAGIPLSVVNGDKKLSDHFSKEYIDSQCGVK